MSGQTLATNYAGGRQPRTIPTKDLPHQVVFLGGGPLVFSEVRADFREGDEDSNFSVFRVRRFSEWPEPLH